MKTTFSASSKLWILVIRNQTLFLNARVMFLIICNFNENRLPTCFLTLTPRIVGMLNPAEDLSFPPANTQWGKLSGQNHFTSHCMSYDLASQQLWLIFVIRRDYEGFGRARLWAAYVASAYSSPKEWCKVGCGWRSADAGLGKWEHAAVVGARELLPPNGIY